MCICEDGQACKGLVTIVECSADWMGDIRSTSSDDFGRPELEHQFTKLARKARANFYC